MTRLVSSEPGSQWAAAVLKAASAQLPSLCSFWVMSVYSQLVRLPFWSKPDQADRPSTQRKWGSSLESVLKAL